MKTKAYVVTIDPIIKLNETRSNIESRSISEIDVVFPPFLGRRLLIILNFFVGFFFCVFVFLSFASGSSGFLNTMGGGASIKEKEREIPLDENHERMANSKPHISTHESSRPQKIQLENLQIPTTPRQRRLSNQGKNLLWASLSPSPTRKNLDVEPPPSPISHSKRRSITTKPPPSPVPSESASRKKRRSSNVTKRFGRVESPPRVHRKSYFGDQLKENLAKRFRENKSPRKSTLHYPR